LIEYLSFGSNQAPAPDGKMVCYKKTGGSAGLWKMPVDAGPEVHDLQKLFRFNDLSQKAGKSTPDDPTRCRDDFAFATGLKRVAQNPLPHG
jgi:hypothetical protein